MFGDLKRVPLREIWPHEALDFTPWLADNISELGKAIGMEIELVEREASVGDFSLDLLARDLGTSRNVIVENQLTQTNHDHLGKLLTYAAGFDAAVIIWLAESIRDEHRQTMDWLNHCTDSETLFFGVVVEVIQIDDSKPAFNFKLVATPNEWQKSKARSSQRAGISKKGEKYQVYFQSLIDDLRENHHFTSAKAGQPQSWYSFGSGITGVTLGANFCQGGRARSEIYIDFGEHEKNKYLFDELKKESALIESSIGNPISWERLDEKRSSRLALYMDGSIESSESELESVKSWHIENLKLLKKHTMPKIMEIVKSM